MAPNDPEFLLAAHLVHSLYYLLAPGNSTALKSLSREVGTGVWADAEVPGRHFSSTRMRYRKITALLATV